jgi:phage terminase large subunit-like protein
MQKSQHLKDVDKYVNDVIAHRKLANKFEIAACRRYKNDLKRSRTRAYEYRFDAEKADRAIRFMELMPHTKGHWARMVGTDCQIRFGGWQKFIIANIFGWVHKETGLRRFRIAFCLIPRKNGKSVKGATIGHYMFTADDEFGAEVYCGATTEKQAWEVFRPAKIMAERTAQYRSKFGIKVHAKTMDRPHDGSKFEPIIGNPGDGASPSCAIVDEYHEHVNDELYDTMLTGMGARLQPLMLVISTAGSDISGPCYQMQKDIEKILDGVISNEQTFGIIFTIDKDDDWTSEESLIKANPNYGVSVMRDFLKSQLRDAIQSPRKQNTFKRKHLNIWVNARDAWMNMQQWNALADPTLRAEDFVNDKRYKALDLSSKLDITADVDIYTRIIDLKQHYYVIGKFYLPEDAAQDEGKDHYQGWVNEGALIATDGNIIDYESIEENIVAECKENRPEQIGYDPWGATQLCQRLQDNQRLDVIEIPQNVKHLSEPMKWVEAMVKSGRLHHNGNPVLNWMMSNVVCKTDANDNIYPRKETEENKIDGAVATIMAMLLAMQNDKDSGSVYETQQRGILTFG